jgi:uncharacterized membrane protein YdbT with pleckstrin-like domain
LCALYSIIKGGMIEIGITNHRIIYKTGIVARDVLEIELASIDSIRVRQTFFERLFDRGRLVVRSVGGAVITTEPVRHPLRLRGSIMALEEEAEAALPVAD